MRCDGRPGTSLRTWWRKRSWWRGGGWTTCPRDALPWLYGVARRVLANERRSAGRRAALEQRVATTAADASKRGEAAAADALGDAELLRAALGRLSDDHREALMLVAWQGLSGAQAARAAGCTTTAFAVRLHRARNKLKAQLAALEPPGAHPSRPDRWR